MCMCQVVVVDVGVHTAYLGGFVLQDLETLMDPSRNMAKYRNLLNSEHIQPPVVSLLHCSLSV